MVHVYGSDFFSYTDQSSGASAGAVIRALQTVLKPASVLDVGCARGTWLLAWSQTSGCEVTGVDGHYVDIKGLRIPADRFLPRDLNQSFTLGRRFDLAQSLEVAEHLPESRAAGFVADLVAHADMVLFAAARPGQGGEHHINEQPYDYWRALFARHDYVAIDFLRPAIAGRHDVSSWYRYNTLLYVARSRLAELPEALTRAILPEDRPIPDFAPLWFRLRCALVRILPLAVQNAIAQALARIKGRETSL